MKSGPFPMDLQTIRTFIMYDALCKRAPFDGFKIFCEAIGDLNFEFPEYEFWYYHFYSGNLNLHFDPRSLDPPQLKFDDLPNEILVGIVEHLDVKSRLLTRKVSRKLRHLGFQTRKPVRIENIGLVVYRDRMALEIDKKEFVYLNEYLCHTGNSKKFDYGEESLPFAISDVRTFLEIPRLEIGNLCISEVKSITKFIENLLKVPNISKLHVTHVEINFEEPQFAIKTLNLLEPEFLKKILLEFDLLEEPLNIDEFASMEQFKKAKIININSNSALNVAHLHLFYHFEEFQIRLESIQSADVVALRNDFASSAHFRKCTIYVLQALDMTDIRRMLGFEENPNHENHAVNWIRENEILPNRQEFLQIQIHAHMISISKEPIYSYGMNLNHQRDISSDDDSSDYISTDEED